MLSSKWRRSPSQGKCSRRFCGSSRNCGRSLRLRRREAFDGHVVKHNRQEECVQMPVKIVRSAPRPSFGLPELLLQPTPRVSLAATLEKREYHASSESSGESRHTYLQDSTCRARKPGKGSAYPMGVSLVDYRSS